MDKVETVCISFLCLFLGVFLGWVLMSKKVEEMCMVDKGFSVSYKEFKCEFVGVHKGK